MMRNASLYLLGAVILGQGGATARENLDLDSKRHSSLALDESSVLVGDCATLMFEQTTGMGNDRSSAAGICPLHQGPCDDAALRDAFTPAAGDPVLPVKVKVNVFCDDFGQNCVSDQASIDEQMTLTNSAFAPGGILLLYTTEFIPDSRFVGLDPDRGLMQSLYADDPQHQLNVFVLAGSGFADAVPPWFSNSLAASGGIRIPGARMGGLHNVLTHEIGHAFGLWHTHVGTFLGTCDPALPDYLACYEFADGSNGDTGGDLCADTKPTPRNYTCQQPGGTDCVGTPWGTTNIENIMGYSGLAEEFDCRDEFSLQQNSRMHCWIDDQLTCWLDVNFGDVNGSDQIDISDLVYLIAYVFNNGPAPVPSPNVADFDCSGIVDIDDIYFLSDYIFSGGPKPTCCAD